MPLTSDTYSFSLFIILTTIVQYFYTLIVEVLHFETLILNCEHLPDIQELDSRELFYLLLEIPVPVVVLL